MPKKKKIDEVVMYQTKSGEIAFRGDFTRDTIWATQKQISEVFGVNTRTVNEHLQNIYKDKELEKKATIRKFRIVQKEGKRDVERDVLFYNLDSIISVGYRVNSKRATEFRIWATKILRQHITRGYTINKKVIGKNYEKFMKAVSDVQKLLPRDTSISTESILDLIKAFAGTWVSLESYDEGKFPQKGFTKKDVQVQANDLYGAVADLKRNLIKKKQATDMFAQEKRKGSMEGILGNVMQSVYGKDVYKSIEEKAAHLLYFMVKNHPFTDGNKRSGAFAFIWFLNRVQIPFREKITPEALTAITLLVAESKPKEKDRMIGLVLLLLKR